jgi:hypothetical protein
VEWIRIHRRDSLAVAIAEQINKELQTHPVLDEDHASELEFSEAETFWAGLSHGERLHFCEQAGLPPSTEEYLPEDPRGALHEILISP